jgi:ABC-2 type transport system ATP-binding protein
MNTIVNALNLRKEFNGKTVLEEVSFSVEKGEVFGLLGPNGSGKTTSIRMLMNILKPDSGDIAVLGTSSLNKVKDKVGYLPEERGLYKKLSVFDSLIYFATLKGVAKDEARDRAIDLLNKVGMYNNRKKKIDELSKGMQQKIQFITTFIHNPELVILDEPFSGLDPVNTKLIKDMILELKSGGKTIILSTHMMDQVERMCDRVLMINNGMGVLYGKLNEIKARYGNNSIILEFDGQLKDIRGVEKIENFGKYAELFLDGNTKAQDVLEQLIDMGITINRFEISSPSLNEIFIDIVEGEK